MIFDFSSAFNTIQPHLLANKGIHFKLHNTTIAWVFSYLLSRPQFVRLDNKLSDYILTKAGAQQGTVLSPFLFTLHPVGLWAQSGEFSNSKVLDDTALLNSTNTMTLPTKERFSADDKNRINNMIRKAGSVIYLPQTHFRLL